MTTLPVILLTVMVAAGGLGSLEAPPFHIHYSAALAAEARSLAAAAPGTIARLTESMDAPPLPPANLYLVSGADAPAPVSSIMPEWAAGIAVPGLDTIVIRADRVGPYGQRQLQGVFAHEVAHMLMDLAAGRGAGAMPSWFNEGVAANLARDGEWMEFLYLWVSPVASSSRPLSTLEACFGSMGTPALRRAAYAGSYSFVRFAIARHGPRLPARVLSGLASGLGFERSWAAAAGTTLLEDEAVWSSSIRGSRRWFAILTSSFALWMTITLLLLLAYRIKRVRSRRIMEAWHDDDPLS